MEAREHIECQERNMEIPAVMITPVKHKLRASQGNREHIHMVYWSNLRTNNWP